MTAVGSPPTPASGAPARVRLRFEPSGRRGARAAGRDACSTPRAGTASRSTRPAARTAPARSAASASTVGEVPVTKLDARVFTPDELREGWRLACRAQAVADLGVDVPPLATRPEGGDGRRRPPGDPAPGRQSSATWSSTEPTLRRPAQRRSSASRRASRTSAARRRCDVLRELPQALRARRLEGHRGVVDDVLIDVEPGDTTARRFAHRLRPRHDDRGGDAARPRRPARPWRCARCSTASSRSAPT